jgi:hypothetical protein
MGMEALTGLPDGVVGVELVGKVEAKDYDDVLQPLVEGPLNSKSARVVIVMGDRYEGYSAGAAMEDAKFGFEHLAGWKRTALVSDHDWVKHFASLFGWMMPGKFKTFPLADKDKAIAWTAADD